MRIKVLMVGSENDIRIDAELLRDKGFMVYTCKDETVTEMVDEIHPNVVFIGSEAKSMATYNTIVDSSNYAEYPVIYTLAEDDMYLVNRKRTSRNNRTIISDNIVDSIKTALIGSKILTTASKTMHLPYYSNRA